MRRVNRRAFLRATGGAATIGILAGCTGDGGDGGGDGGDGGGDGGATDTPADGGTDTPADGGTTGTTDGGGTGEPIVVGALEPISGPFAPWATPHRDGLQFAVEQINANGGVLGGRNLQVEVADTGADPAQANTSFRRLVEQEGAVATTGAVSSDVGLRVAQTAAELEVPHLLHMSGTDDVITQDTSYIFRVGLLPATKYIQAQATAFADAGYSNIGAIVADYAWGHSAREAINEHFDANVDIKVAPIGASDFSSYLRQFSDDLDMLVASGHPPGSVSISNQAFELGLSPDVITGASTPPQLLSGALSDQAIDAYVHIHNSNPYGQAFTSAAQAFAEGHEAQFNTHTAYGYATAQLLAAGIEDAGSAEPTAISEAVHQLSLETVFAQPIQYNQYGELDETVVLFSRLLQEAPSYDPNGSYSYEELYRSESVPARVPGQ